MFDLHGAQLLEAIFARPDEDAPRRVFADWLLERGDDWGRFISAQLERDAVAAFRLLPHVRERACLGWPCERVRDQEFSRGFLSRVYFDLASPAEADDSKLLIWGIVRSLDCPFRPDAARAATLRGAADRGRLRALTSFSGDSDTLDAIAAADPTPRLESVLVRGTFTGAGLQLARPTAELSVEHANGFRLKRQRNSTGPSLLVAGGALHTEIVRLTSQALARGTEIVLHQSNPYLAAALAEAGFFVRPA